MRKILLLSLAILFIAAIANATNIPVTVDPKEEPIVWTEMVYNNSAATIVSGYIVKWNFDASDSATAANDDMCNSIEVGSANSVWTAGVVPYGNNIANGDTGSIIIRGPAYVYESTTGVTANQIAFSDASGRARDSDVSTNDEGSLGVCILDDPASAGPDDNSTAWCIIFIDPTQHEI